MKKTVGNPSWCEKAKVIIGTTVEEGYVNVYHSLFEAATEIANERGCRKDTVKKCIRLSMKRGGSAYGMHWHYKDEEQKND